MSKIEYEAYEKLQKESSPDVPEVKDSDNKWKVITWAPIFIDCMSRTYGIKSPLVYMFCENVTVAPEDEDPLLDNNYFGVSGGLQSELISHLSHGDALF